MEEDGGNGHDGGRDAPCSSAVDMTGSILDDLLSSRPIHTDSGTYLYPKCQENAEVDEALLQRDDAPANVGRRDLALIEGNHHCQTSIAYPVDDPASDQSFDFLCRRRDDDAENEHGRPDENSLLTAELISKEGTGR